MTYCSNDLVYKVETPGRDRNSDFQPRSFHCTFLIRQLNAHALGFSMLTGTPRYFPHDISSFIKNMVFIRFPWSSYALGERNMKDLDVLISSPEAMQNSCIIWYRTWQCCCWIVVKMTTSSANKRLLTGGAALEILIPWHYYHSWVCSKLSERTSIHRMKI